MSEAGLVLVASALLAALLGALLAAGASAHGLARMDLGAVLREQ